MNRDSYAGSAGSPQTLNRYSYGFNNPVKYTDHSGNWACEDAFDSNYREFCENRLQRLKANPAFTQKRENPDVDESNPSLVRWKNVDKSDSLGALMDLFLDYGSSNVCPTMSDDTLPGDQYGYAGKVRRPNMSRARERMEFVLWLAGTAGQQRLFFGGTGFASNVSDFNYYTPEAGIGQSQVLHFLFPAGSALNNNIFAFAAFIGDLGHEKHEGGFPILDAVFSFYDGYVDTFWGDAAKAVEYDAQGGIAARDAIIANILPSGTPEKYDQENRIQDPGFRGLSRQDLRLTIKGWNLGIFILNDPSMSKTPSDVHQWMENNVRNNN